MANRRLTPSCLFGRGSAYRQYYYLSELQVLVHSATSSYKPATLETGLSILVPQFIGVGDRIKINTGTGEYVERA
ncbi:MAG: hypothetical protein HY028_05450 [Gammaproteobacteria bacterium]|nr:hypothetical protein [Gammaproteobacteria bacterium]